LHDISKQIINNTKNSPSLKSFPDFSKMIISNVDKLSRFIYDILSLKPFDDVLKNIMNDFLGLGKSLILKLFPDMSELNNFSLKYSEYLFIKPFVDISNCKASINNISWKYKWSCLKLLPDISKWDTRNVLDMSFLFYNCTSLKALPDISKWNISNANNISGIFSGCSSLEELPDISNWNTGKIKYLI